MSKRMGQTGLTRRSMGASHSCPRGKRSHVQAHGADGLAKRSMGCPPQSLSPTGLSSGCRDCRAACSAGCGAAGHACGAATVGLHGWGFTKPTRGSARREQGGQR